MVLIVAKIIDQTETYTASTRHVIASSILVVECEYLTAQLLNFVARSV